ncbi:MAG: tetratricopeptide repeat protein, partial [Candidatus Zixiibacteriota bacterium]
LMLLVTLGLFGFVSYYPFQNMWGANHLRFLPALFTYFYWTVCVLIVLLVYRRISMSWLQGLFKRIDDLLWGNKIWGRLTIAVLLMLVFYQFRTKTHFLGDGYTWLSTLGTGEGFHHKWTELGSIFLVRKLQTLMGGYSPETALHAFQALSILSGGVVVYNLISILKRLCKNTETRLIGLVTLLASGVLLLFCGYVEFYHVLWASASIFINLSLKYLSKGRGLVLVIASFMAALLMHMQAFYFIGGLLFILLSKQFLKSGTLRLQRHWLIALAIIGLGGILAFQWLYTSRIDVETMFLPLFTGRPQSPDYAVFTVKHFADIANLVLLMFPGILVLFALWLQSTPKLTFNPTTIFLGLLSAGSLAFLLTVDPTIGMGRDWDLMSLTLLPPCLLLVHQLDRAGSQKAGKTILGYGLVCGFMTLSFLAAATVETSSVNRYHSLLQYYGRKHRSGWTILAKYYKGKNDIMAYQKIALEMDALFPYQQKLNRVNILIERGDYYPALKLARELVKENPYQPDFLQAMGYAHAMLNVLDSAEYYYRQAIALRPHHFYLDELGIIYLKQQKYQDALDIFRKARQVAPEFTPAIEGVGFSHLGLGHLDSASAIADSLFLNDENSPGGHVLQLIIALKRGNREKAKFHYKEFLQHGAHWSDYRKIKENYSFLLQ